MAVKKAAAVKKAPAKATAKKPATRKSSAGDTLACQVCGLVVTVDEVCGCVEEHEIICCGSPMKEKKQKVTKVKVKAK